MNTVLLILGVLGVGAILIAAYVFTVAARNYVSEADQAQSQSKRKDSNKGTITSMYIIRSTNDRRNDKRKKDFPLTLPGGQVVKLDRRNSPERRVANA